MMQLQIALDRLDLDVAVRLTADVASYADWIEAGTSLIKKYGIRSVSEVAAAAGATPVLADLKTADDARTEFALAFDHGARSATVLAAAADPTIDRCVELAAEAGAEVMVDLLEVTPQRRAALLQRLPANVVFAAHIGKDAQAAGDCAGSALRDWTGGRRVAVAGGLTEASVARLRSSHPGVRVIAGSAITQAPEPREAARRMCAAVRGELNEH